MNPQEKTQNPTEQKAKELAIMFIDGKIDLQNFIKEITNLEEFKLPGLQGKTVEINDVNDNERTE